jgi:hypothetical protein
LLSTIIDGVRKVSDADILLLEGTPGGEPVYPIYKALGYNFPRVLMLDVKDCTLVEVDNPLARPFAVPTFWVPNVILASDYLVTVAPLKVVGGWGSLSIANLLSLLPSSKYRGPARCGWGALSSLGMDKVLADLYFTLPFDLGIIEASSRLTAEDEATQGEVDEYGKVFIGEPFDVDCQASEALGFETEHLDLIDAANVEFETQGIP